MNAQELHDSMITDPNVYRILDVRCQWLVGEVAHDNPVATTILHRGVQVPACQECADRVAAWSNRTYTKTRVATANRPR